MRKLTCLFPELMAAGNRTAMFFPKLFPTLQDLPTLRKDFFFYLFQYGSQFEQTCKSAKVFFSYFIDLLLNIFAVNLFVGIFTQIRYLNSQGRFSPV